MQALRVTIRDVPDETSAELDALSHVPPQYPLVHDFASRSQPLVDPDLLDGAVVVVTLPGLLSAQRLA